MKMPTNCAKKYPPARKLSGNLILNGPALTLGVRAIGANIADQANIKALQDIAGMIPDMKVSDLIRILKCEAELVGDSQNGFGIEGAS